MYSEYDVRMKSNYEKRSVNHLTRRIPVIIRIDGKCFSSFCKRFNKPYDEVLNNSLNRVMKFLCENIQGAKFAERHSDEISILLTDFDSLQTDCWFNYNTQKICSIAASMATSEFCRILVEEEIHRTAKYSKTVNSSEELQVRTEFQQERNNPYLNWDEKWPTFDARCFNIPMEEVANYYWWRMLDAKRGSINMTGQAHFPHKKLKGLSCDNIQEKLWQEKNINWAKLPQGQKIGFTCERKQIEKPIPKGPNAGENCIRNIWSIEESPSSKTELDVRIKSITFNNGSEHHQKVKKVK